MNLLSDISYGKIIPRNYGNIKHLKGSRLKDSGDTLLDEIIQPYFTEKLQFPNRDKLYVTEKIDGANVGVAKLNGVLHPIMRKGYDVRTSDQEFIRKFSIYVSDNTKRFNSLLNDGERVCGEWMVKTHSLFYNLPHEPFVVFDIIKSGKKQTRPSYDEIIDRCSKFEFITTGLIWSGEAISIQNALDKLGNGFHGCKCLPEGVVYRYERDETFENSAKFVSNLDVNGDYMNDPTAFNTWVNWTYQ